MSRTRLTIDPDNPQDVPVGRVDNEVLDATDQEDITRQARDDDAEARRDIEPTVRGRPRPHSAFYSPLSGVDARVPLAKLRFQSTPAHFPPSLKSASQQQMT